MINSVNKRVKEYYRDCGKNITDGEWSGVWEKIRGYPSFLYQSKRISDTIRILNKSYFKKPILDAACGSGYILSALPKGSVGIELNPRHVKRALVNAPEAKVIKGDIEHIIYPDNYFNTVIITEVFEHIPDPKIIISEVWRVLKKGGKVVVTVPNRKYLWNVRFLASNMYVTEPHCKNFKKEQILSLFSDYKYKLCKYELIAYGLNHLIVLQKI